MQYGQINATRFQQNAVQVQSSSWTKLEGATPLARRVGTEVFNKGASGTVKMYITHTLDGSTPTTTPALCPAVEIGSFHFVPNGPGLTLWGRMQASNGRVIVTEYGV